MRAFVLTGPREFEVQDVADAAAAPGQVVIDVQRVGVCGTDVEFFTGEMQYLHDGHATYPLRLGHEWMGTVAAVGDGVDPSLDRSAGHGRHDARLRHVPPLPRRAPARLCDPVRGRDPRAAFRARSPSSSPCR